MIQVDRKEFIRQLKIAPQFYLSADRLLNLILSVKNERGEISVFLSPDFDNMTEPDVREFLAEVDYVCSLPDVRRKRLA